MSSPQILISKEFAFSAAHRIEGLGESHKCARLHGHTYRVRIELEGRIDETGILVDYGEVAWMGIFIQDRLDHRNLNDVVQFNPTAENLAIWLLEETTRWLGSRPERSRIEGASVGVSESPSTWAVASARFEA